MSQRITALRWLGWEHMELPPELVAEVSEADNLAYAKAIMVCAAGDGEISPAEREWIVGYLTVARDPDAVVELMRTYDGGDDIGELIAASPLMLLTGRSMLFDALRACASDGDLSSGERDRVHTAADRLGVPRDVVAEFEEIIQAEESLRKRKHQLLVAEPMAALRG